MIPEIFGIDANKDGCKRGKSAGVARFCSPDIRECFPQSVLRDRCLSDWCVCSRNKDNCCFMKISDSVRLCKVNIAESLNTALRGNDAEQYKELRLRAFMTQEIGRDYPAADEQTVLKITVNGEVWMEYYLKLSKDSTIFKTISPSGYRYNDRVSFGSMVMVRGKGFIDDLVFFITKDSSKVVDEKTHPVVNGVGFWFPEEAGDIRNIIHLNDHHALNCEFGFFVKKGRQDQVRQIKVEIVNNHTPKPITLWEFPTKRQISPEPVVCLQQFDQPPQTDEKSGFRDDDFITSEICDSHPQLAEMQTNESMLAQIEKRNGTNYQPPNKYSINQPFAASFERIPEQLADQISQISPMAPYSTAPNPDHSFAPTPPSPESADENANCSQQPSASPNPLPTLYNSMPPNPYHQMHFNSNVATACHESNSGNQPGNGLPCQYPSQSYALDENDSVIGPPIYDPYGQMPTTQSAMSLFRGPPLNPHFNGLTNDYMAYDSASGRYGPSRSALDGFSASRRDRPFPLPQIPNLPQLPASDSFAPAAYPRHQARGNGY